MRGSRLLATVSGGALAFAACAAGAQQQSTETYQYDALGRVVSATTDGGQNSGEAHSVCYDPAGNRTKYRSTSDGSLAGCVDTGSGPSTPMPTPTPTPPPAPSNAPPVTTADYVGGVCLTSLTANLTANDSDPEDNLPLVLLSIMNISGSASASVVSASSVRVNLGPQGDSSSFTYTVRDSLGATSTGTLGASSYPTGCGGIEQ